MYTSTCKKQFMSFPPQFFLTVSHKMWRFDWPNDNMTWNSKNNHCSSCATTKLTFQTELKYIPKSWKKKSNSWKNRPLLFPCCLFVIRQIFFSNAGLVTFIGGLSYFLFAKNTRLNTHNTCGNNEVGNVLFLYAWIKCQKVWVKLWINILNDR